MKVRAKHWICVNGVWRRVGEEFEVSRTDMEQMNGSVEIVETPLTWDEPEEEKAPESTAKRGGRRKKAEE